MTEAKQLNIAFIGCGGIAAAHWQGIQSHAQRLTVTAAVDIDADRAAAMATLTGAQPFTSLETALAQGNFDAVDIMLPHKQHEEAVELAFAAGKHVLLEKPMATTLAGCTRIMAAAGTAGSRCQRRRCHR